MASKTKATEMKRLRRNKRMGAKRKSELERKGTTPSSAALFGDAKS